MAIVSPKIIHDPKHETRAQLQRIVANHLASDTGRRRQVYLFVIAAVFLFLVVMDHSLDSIGEPMSSSSLRKPHDHNNGAMLTVISRYRHPVVLATLRGYKDGSSMCSNDYIQTQQQHVRTGDDGALFKLTVLSDTIEDKDEYDNSYSFVQVHATRIRNIDNETTADTEEWETRFRFNVAAPPSQYTSGVTLCYAVEYRVEYMDYNTSMADYPTELCSFVGHPTFYRGWDSRYFVSDDQRRKQPNAHQTNWLVRKSSHEEWQWMDDSSVNVNNNGGTPVKCKSWQQERSYSLVIIGDSQPSYTCHHLLHGVIMGDENIIINNQNQDPTANNPKIRCVTIKRTLQNSTTFDQYAHKSQSSTEDFVIFNPSGLWEAAYGSLNDFRTNLQRLLTHVPMNTTTATVTNNKRYYFLAPTTAVHPINYPNLPFDNKKWSMTQPRVRAINSIAKELVYTRQREMNAAIESSNADDTTTTPPTILANLAVPWDEISLSRDDDPMTFGDMRHYNVSTNELLLTSLLCKLDEIWEEDGYRE